MYTGNTIGRRRPEGWAERRRYFKKLLTKLRPENVEKTDDKPAPSSK